MSDPLAQVVSLLQPGAAYSKIATGAGLWSVHRSEEGRPFYCAVLEGSCCLHAQGHAPISLQANDFVLIPAIQDFSMSSMEAPGQDHETVMHAVEGGVHLGALDEAVTVRVVIGYCQFMSPDSDLLISLLPQLIHIRGEKRLATLVEMVREESRAERLARDIILEHLLQILFLEALRTSADLGPSPGLLRGLADPCLSRAIRKIHSEPAHPWDTAELAREAALSRTSFFDRFQRAMGMAPKEYLLSWRMALAKNLLRHQALSVAEVAERVGYSSASTFTIAFTRSVGTPPARYKRGAVGG